MLRLARQTRARRYAGCGIGEGCAIRARTGLASGRRARVGDAVPRLTRALARNGALKTADRRRSATLSGAGACFEGVRWIVGWIIGWLSGAAAIFEFFRSGWIVG